MKQVQKIIGPRMMLLAAQESHAPFILDLRNQERKRRFLSGVSRTLTDQIAWMQQRSHLLDDAYFVVTETKNPSIPLGSIRLHDVIAEKNSIRVSSWVMVDGVVPRKSLEALALAIEYIMKSGYSVCHFEVHKKSLSASKLYIKLGTQVVGQTEHTFLLSCAPALFLNNMAKVFKIEQPQILRVEP